MRNVAFWFFATATIYVTIGMVWGIVMSASGDHTLGPAHAHLNLIGWVTMALFGVYYQLVPQAARGLLPRAHFAIATAGVVLIVPGIAMAVQGGDETLAKIGSLLTVLSMVLFVYVVFRHKFPISQAASPVPESESRSAGAHSSPASPQSSAAS